MDDPKDTVSPEQGPLLDQSWQTEEQQNQADALDSTLAGRQVLVLGPVRYGKSAMALKALLEAGLTVVIADEIPHTRLDDSLYDLAALEVEPTQEKSFDDAAYRKHDLWLAQQDRRRQQQLHKLKLKTYKR